MVFSGSHICKSLKEHQLDVKQLSTFLLLSWNSFSKVGACDQARPVRFFHPGMITMTYRSKIVGAYCSASGIRMKLSIGFCSLDPCRAWIPIFSEALLVQFSFNSVSHNWFLLLETKESTLLDTRGLPTC